jgi:mono/diheme cytochrome c family protein
LVVLVPVTAFRYTSDTMRDARRTLRPTLFFILVSGLLGTALFESGAAEPIGSAERGRELFNGRGICSYCHGVDGRLGRRPQLSPDVEGVISRLSPPPSDLRDAKALEDKNDKARFRTIRAGHSGTAMLPDARLTDQDIHDLVAYLAVIRQEGQQP